MVLKSPKIKMKKGFCTEATPEKLVLQQSGIDVSITISRLIPTTSYRTLDIWIAAEGNQRKQLPVSQGKVDTWINAIKTRSLNAQDKRLTYC